MISRIDTAGGDPWFVVRVRPNCEWKAAASLGARGFEVLVPDFERPTRRAPRKPVRLPLFPGYLFCQFDGQSLVPILSAAGVVQILSRNGAPEPVEQSEIISITTLIDRGMPLQPWPIFERGAPVRVFSGPLAGVQGIVLRDEARTKLIISISLLQRSVVAEIDRAWVQSIAPHPDRSNRLPADRSEQARAIRSGEYLAC